MPRKLLLVATLVAAALTAALTTTAAGADTDVTPVPTTSPVTAQWITAPCATGELASAWTDAYQRTLIHGSVTACGVRKPNATFTAVLFRPDRDFAIAVDTGLRPYAPVGPTPVVGLLYAPPGIDTVAVCLARSTTARIACARFDLAPGQPAVMHPIGTDDPLVDKPIVLVEDLPGIRPPSGFCGSCVALP